MPYSYYGPYSGNYNQTTSYLDVQNSKLYWFDSFTPDANYCNVNVLDLGTHTKTTVPCHDTYGSIYAFWAGMIAADTSYIYAYRSSGYDSQRLCRFDHSGNLVTGLGSLGPFGPPWWHGYLQTSQVGPIHIDAGTVSDIDWTSAVMPFATWTVTLPYNITATRGYALDWNNNKLYYLQYGTPSYVSVIDLVAHTINSYSCTTTSGVNGACYIPADNSVIFTTTNNLYKWDVATHSIIATQAIGGWQGSSQNVGGDGNIIEGINTISGSTLATALTRNLTNYGLAGLDISQSNLYMFMRPYVNGAVYVMGSDNNVYGLYEYTNPIVGNYFSNVC